MATIRSIPNTIKLGQFSGEQKSVSCRLQPMELKGTLEDIDVDCGIISASWVIEMEMTIGTLPPFTVKTVRAFDGNYFGGVVLTRADTAFVPAVQDLVNDVLTNPSFLAAARAQK